MKRIDAFFTATAVREVKTENLNRKKKVSVFFLFGFFARSKMLIWFIIRLVTHNYASYISAIFVSLIF
ncbi:hypothetical protein ABIE26_001698 [Pedobacter africanus]|uniref:Uncharacterized protein n=1 Tax=Pedobacter africanus TaxID=151894 RepID=A0ACC6KRM5_9SPHI|nr:hypothetical protein [Pedobacter africanus]